MGYILAIAIGYCIGKAEKVMQKAKDCLDDFMEGYERGHENS